MQAKNMPYLLLLLLLSTSIFAQTAALKGVLQNEGEALPFANVALKNTNYGVASDENGAFEIQNIPLGEYQLQVSAIGYQSHRQFISLQSTGTVDLGILKIASSELELDAIVVTGTMKETYLSQSPVKIDVITPKLFEKRASTNALQAVTMVNGIQEVVACGVCFTNSININGLEGPYTAVLVDGTPMFGNLASVYGLNGIPSSVIERMEVIKGPSSTLYGSEAIAGVINIITKSPEDQPFLTVDLLGSSHFEGMLDMAIAPKIGKWRGLVSWNQFNMNNFINENEDAFADIVHLDRTSIFTKWSLQRPQNQQFNLSAKYYYEDRRNGTEEYLKDRNYRNLRGSDQIYGESIYTNRLELFGTYELPTSPYLRLDYSFSTHEQDSYYGSDYYQAEQDITFANLIWNEQTNKQDWTLGATARYQYYDDNTQATGNEAENEPSRQFIPGVFAQNEINFSDKWTVLAGARLDHYDEHGLIFAPRLNVKYQPSTWTTLRGNFGTGFRVVNLFTEDHAFVSGNRSVTILEDLQPEKSYNLALNLNHVYAGLGGQGTLGIDAFYTYFTNAIFPNYEEAGQIIYQNTDGHAVSQGIGFDLQHYFAFPLSVNISSGLLNTTRTERDEEGNLQTSKIEFAPNWSGNFTVSYQFRKIGLSIDYTGSITGQMALPEVFDVDPLTGNLRSTPRPTTSTTYTIQNLQLTKEFQPSSDTNSGQSWKIYTGIRNLFDWRQQSPLVGFNDPNFPTGFSPNFDTAYAYGPIHGREIYLGVRWKL